MESFPADVWETSHLALCTQTYSQNIYTVRVKIDAKIWKVFSLVPFPHL